MPIRWRKRGRWRRALEFVTDVLDMIGNIL